jgi:hypothetical protein
MLFVQPKEKIKQEILQFQNPQLEISSQQNKDKVADQGS